jgi:hypothetical protein
MYIITVQPNPLIDWLIHTTIVKNKGHCTSSPKISTLRSFSGEGLRCGAAVALLSCWLSSLTIEQNHKHLSWRTILARQFCFSLTIKKINRHIFYSSLNGDLFCVCHRTYNSPIFNPIHTKALYVAVYSNHKVQESGADIWGEKRKGADLSTRGLWFLSI